MCVKTFSLLLSQAHLALRRSALALSVISVGAMGCATSAHGFRLNPEEEPEQYRVTCKKRFYYCELQAQDLCDGEYTELGRLSNLPELPLVKDADVSSTGPRQGVQYWQGELTVQCGRALPNLPLARPETLPAAPPPAVVVPATSPRVCVPGATQECLGPGACKGAQACSELGQGFGPCDCGTGLTPGNAQPSGPAPAASPPQGAAVNAPPLVSTPAHASTPPAVSNSPVQLVP